MTSLSELSFRQRANITDLTLPRSRLSPRSWKRGTRSLTVATLAVATAIGIAMGLNSPAVSPVVSPVTAGPIAASTTRPVTDALNDPNAGAQRGVRDGDGRKNDRGNR